MHANIMVCMTYLTIGGSESHNLLPLTNRYVTIIHHRIILPAFTISQVGVYLQVFCMTSHSIHVLTFGTQ